MAQVCWQATANGRYFIDVFLGNDGMKVMVDSGLVDPMAQVGFEVEPAIFDQLEKTGALVKQPARRWRNASGLYAMRRSGEVTAQLCDPATKGRIGPAVRLHVTRGAPLLPNRAGVVFFHGLTGCR